MKLALITDDGEIIDVTEDVEEYDLEKPFARASVIDDVKREVEMQQQRERDAVSS